MDGAQRGFSGIVPGFDLREVHGVGKAVAVNELLEIVLRFVAELLDGPGPGVLLVMDAVGVVFVATFA